VGALRGKCARQPESSGNSTRCRCSSRIWLATLVARQYALEHPAHDYVLATARGLVLNSPALPSGPDQIQPQPLAGADKLKKGRSERYRPRAMLMATFVYRCPNTGLQVQGYWPGEVAEDSGTYEGILCAMCQRIHLVNPATGEVAGDAATTNVAHISCRTASFLSFGWERYRATLSLRTVLEAHLISELSPGLPAGASFCLMRGASGVAC